MEEDATFDYTVEKAGEITMFWHRNVPLLTRLPGKKELLTTDGERREDQRQTLNYLLSPHYRIDSNWIIHSKNGYQIDFYDGIDGWEVTPMENLGIKEK